MTGKESEELAKLIVRLGNEQRLTEWYEKLKKGEGKGSDPEFMSEGIFLLADHFSGGDNERTQELMKCFNFALKVVHYTMTTLDKATLGLIGKIVKKAADEKRKRFDKYCERRGKDEN